MVTVLDDDVHDTVQKRSDSSPSVSLYQQRLMEYYQNKRYFGTFENPTVCATASSPSCGDVIVYQAMIEDGRIVDVRFQAQGCVIAVSAAAMLAEYLMDKDLSFVQSFNTQQMKDLMGIDLGPVRLRCALLCVDAVKNSIACYDAQGSDKE